MLNRGDLNMAKQKYTNELGKFIEANPHLSYQKIASHAGISRQTMWEKCHGRPLEKIRVGEIESVAKVIGLTGSQLLAHLKGE